MTDAEIWFEKYRPKSIDDLVISNTKKDLIRQWFIDFQAGTTSQFAILLIGPPGLGKTTLAHIILHEFKYHVKEFNASDIRSKALIEENLSGLVKTPSNFLASRRRNFKGGSIPINGVIMDEVDGMFKGDRGGVDALLSFITPTEKYGPDKPHNRKVPIICICNIGNVKKETINSLRKDCFTIEFTVADSISLSKAADRVIQSEKMRITDEAKKTIVEYSQGDFRRLLNILEFIDLYKGKILIDDQILDRCFSLICRKDQDLYITDAIRELINARQDPVRIQAIYNGDKSKTPMVIHQNYLRSISVMKTTAMNKINLALVVVNSLITSDVIEKIMYNTQNWSLQPIQSYTCAHIPNYYMNLASKTTQVDAKWASVLSINSQAQNLRKNIYLELHKLSNHKTYNIADLQHIIELVFIRLINNDILPAVELLYSYNLFSLDNDTVTQSHFTGKVITELSKKKALLIIDKLAKYIKISPYYEQWNQFKYLNKNNKELDGQIKSALIEKIGSDTSLTMKIHSTHDRKAGKPKTSEVKAQVKSQVQAPLDEVSSCYSSIYSNSSTHTDDSTSADTKSKIKLKAKIKPKEVSDSKIKAKEVSDAKIKPKEEPKTLEIQKQLVQERKSVVIKKKVPV
jgi:DNA polymerase III delta prime subunit